MILRKKVIQLEELSSRNSRLCRSASLESRPVHCALHCYSNPMLSLLLCCYHCNSVFVAAVFLIIIFCYFNHNFFDIMFV